MKQGVSALGPRVKAHHHHLRSLAGAADETARVVQVLDRVLAGIEAEAQHGHLQALDV